MIVIHAGQYSDGIHPANSGQAGNPITFQAAPGEHVVLNTTTGVRLGANHSYVVVDGFEIHASTQLAALTGSSYITIRNCTLYGGRGKYDAFQLNNASYCIIQNNYLDRQDPDADGSGGDGFKLISGSHHNLIEGNTATRCEHVAFASSYSKADVYQNYNIWRNNTAYKNHTNYSLQDGVQRCVFENNTGYYMGLVWTGGNGNCLQFTGTRCIIRYNTLYDDTATTHTARQWYSIVGSGAGSANGSTPSIEFNKIYNNTVYGENDQGWAKAGWRIDNYKSGMRNANNVFKNNIFARATASQVDDIDATSSSGALSNQYAGNLLCGAGGQAAAISYEFGGGNVTWSLAEAKKNKPAQWDASNKEGDPNFVNTTGQGPAKDFGLQVGSPAIDGGLHLTTATAAGSGMTVTLADAGYFCDGWGIPGVTGDSIQIEGGPVVGIATIDYTTNSVTLNAARSWAGGARVWYYRSDRFMGAAPDMGSHEFYTVPSTPRPHAPTGKINYTDAVKDEGMPESFALEQNYPNPFNPSTVIRYSVGASSHVSLKVFNVLGEQVATLVDEYQTAGSHEVRFSATGGSAQALPNGTYFYRLETESFKETKKMVLLK